MFISNNLIHKVKQVATSQQIPDKVTITVTRYKMVLSNAYDSQGRPGKPNKGYRRDVAKVLACFGEQVDRTRDKNATQG